MLIILGLVLCGTQYGFAEFSHFNFDDYKLIVLNPSLREFHRLPTVLAAGRPMRGLSLMIDYALFGLDPQGYHLENVAWNIFAAILFYALIYRIFRRQRLAGVAAFIFALHPVHTEAVMAIAHRKELMAFVFMLLSYHAFLYRKKFPATALMLGAIFFVLAVLSKQVALILPVIVIVHEWLDSGGSLKAGTFAWAAPLLVIGLVLVLGGVFYPAPVLRDFNPLGRTAPAEMTALSYPRVLATSFSVYPRYFRYLFFPVHFCLAPLIKAAGWTGLRTWLGLAMFCGLIAAAVRLRKNFLFSYSLFWIFLTLLPIMNWVPANAFFAERYLYAPSAGVCLLLAGLWEKLFAARAKLLSESGYGLARGLISALLIWLMLVAPLSIRINALWPRGSGFFLERAAALGAAGGVFALAGALIFAVFSRSRPGARIKRSALFEIIFTYLVLLLLFAGTFVLTEFLVNHRFGFPQMDVAANWGKTLGFIARHARPGPRAGGFFLYPYGTAAAEVSMVLVFMVSGPAALMFVFNRLGRRGERTRPNRGLAWEILVLMLLAMATQGSARSGDWASEVRLWRQTVMEEPKSILGWNNLGKAYMDRRRYALAARAFQETVRLDPEGPDNYRNLGMALLGRNDLAGAGRAYKKAIELSPADVDSMNNLANIQVMAAEAKTDPAGYGQALDNYLKILALDPGNARARHNLAYCYFRLGDLDRAMDEVMKALYLDPHSKSSLKLREAIIKARELHARPGD